MTVLVPPEPMSASQQSSFAARRTRELVLCRYLAEWARSVLRAPGGAAGEEIHLVYVVGFAAPGLGEGHADPLALHCPVQVLDALTARGRRAGRGLRTTAILVEEDPVQAERLRSALDAAGLGERLRETRDLPSLAPGEIAIVNAGFAEVAAELQAYAAGAGNSLLVLDPPAPRLLPLQALRPLLQQPGTDLAIAFPAAGLHKQARFRGIPLADLPVYARRIVEGYSLLFGDPRYEWLSLWRTAEKEGGVEGAAVAEARMLEHYRARLARAAPDAAVRWVPLASPEAAAEPHYLFLVTGDPERALLLNRVLHDARLAGEVAWGDSLSGFVRVEESGVLDLFAAGETGTRPTRTREVNLPALAHEIATTLAGRTVSFRQVLLELVDTELFVEEIKRAMSLLKRDGRVSYAALAPDAEVVFRAR